MSVEDRLRAVGQAAATTVRDVPPLDLPERPEPADRRPLRPRWTSAGRWRPWLVPLAAAAAVIAVAVTLVAVRNIPHRRPAPLATPGTTLGVPRYYVALSASANISYVQAVVGDTRSGARLATVNPPAHQTFAAVTGAADDRTFVLDTRPFTTSLENLLVEPRSFYLLRIAPGTAQPAQLTRLPVPATPAGGTVDSIALSPDGSKLAVMFQDVPWGPPTLRIYSMPGGRLLGAWTAPKDALPSDSVPSDSGTRLYDASTSLSWTDHGRELTFFYAPGRSGAPAPATAIPVPGPSLPRHDLPANSGIRLVLRSLPPAGCVSTLITADGRSFICGAGPVPGQGGTSKPYFAVYSTATGRLTGFLYRYTGSMDSGEAVVLWASPSGGTIAGYLALSTSPQEPPHSEVDVGVFTKGAFRPLPVQLPGGQEPLVEIAF